MRVILLILFICAPCLGQTFEVTVKDPSGALINKAVVQLIKNGKVQSTVDRKSVV